MRIVHRVIAAVSNGTLFGSSRIGRFVGYFVSLAVMVAFLYLMSR